MIQHRMIKSENMQLVPLWTTRICNVGYKTVVKSRRAESCLGIPLSAQLRCFLTRWDNYEQPISGNLANAKILIGLPLFVLGIPLSAQLKCFLTKAGRTVGPVDEGAPNWKDLL